MTRLVRKSLLGDEKLHDGAQCDNTESSRGRERDPEVLAGKKSPRGDFEPESDERGQKEEEEGRRSFAVVPLGAGHLSKEASLVSPGARNNGL